MTYNKIPVNILISLEKLILKFIWNLKQPQMESQATPNSQTILKQSKAGILTHFKTCSFVTPWTVIWQDSSVHGIIQKRILKWVAIPFSRRSSRPRDWTQVSYIGLNPGLLHWRQILYHLSHLGRPQNLLQTTVIKSVNTSRHTGIYTQLDGIEPPGIKHIYGQISDKSA